MAMGKNELNELRRQAERAIADADRFNALNPAFAEGESSIAVARTLMYVGELLADKLDASWHRRKNELNESATAGTDGTRRWIRTAEGIQHSVARTDANRT